MIELILGYVENLTIVCAILGLGGSIITGIFIFATYDMGDMGKHRKNLFWAGSITLVLLLFSCIPSIDMVWKIRIGLIKYQLASPENVIKTTEAIERIGHELEQKYLQNPPEKK